MRARAADRNTKSKNVLHCLSVYYRQRARVRETDRTYVYVRLYFVWIILSLTKHLCLGRKFSMNLKTDSGAKLHRPHATTSGVYLRSRATR